MAKANMQDPLSGEARSAWLAGLTEACNKISGILNMETATFTDLPLTEVFISTTDRYRIYQAPLGNKLWLASPAPVIKKNGVVITPENDHFEIDYLGGSINFDSFVNEDGAKDYYRLTGTDTLTVSATYIVEGSQVIEDIETELENVGLKANHFKGYWATYDALVNGVPTGQTGDYAIVGSESAFYIWDEDKSAWVSTTAEININDYTIPTKAVTQEEYDTLSDAQKQSEILYVITDNNEGSGGGSNTTAQRYSNPNLLDNWYFVDPINQMGQTEYGTTGYTIDRWHWDRTDTIAEIILNDDCITVQENGWLTQFVEMPSEALNNKQITASFLTKENVLLSQTLISTAEDSYISAPWGTCGTWYRNDLHAWRINFSNLNFTYNIVAIKLELGPVQTLAHQDEDGNWVLNDPPPNKALELVKCQRYFQVFATESLRPIKAEDFRPVMRINPTLSTINVNNTTYYTADANL